MSVNFFICEKVVKGEEIKTEICLIKQKSENSSQGSVRCFYERLWVKAGGNELFQLYCCFLVAALC